MELETLSGEDPGAEAAATILAPADEPFIIALINLLNTLIGPEILGGPNAMTFAGVSISIGLMVTTALLSYAATVMVLNLQRFVQAESINDLATRLVGRWFGQLFSCITLALTITSSISYLIVGSDTVTTGLALVDAPAWRVGWRRSIVTAIYSIVLPVALTVPRRMDFIHTASAFAGIAQLFYMIVAIIRGVQYFQDNEINPTCETGFVNLHFFNGFSIYSTLFALPAVILPQLHDFSPSLKRRYWLLGAAFVICVTVDMVSSAILYLMFGIDTSSISLNSFPSSDPLVGICRVGFFLVVNAAYVIVALQIMTDWAGVIYDSHDPTALPGKQRIVCLVLTNVPPVLFAMVLSDVRPVFEIGGAFGGCLSNFFFPPVLYFIFREYKWYQWRGMLLLVFAAFGVVSAGIGTYQAIMDAVSELGK
jgi:amino acid permease